MPPRARRLERPPPFDALLDPLLPLLLLLLDDPSPFFFTDLADAPPGTLEMLTLLDPLSPCVCVCVCVCVCWGGLRVREGRETGGQREEIGGRMGRGKGRFMGRERGGRAQRTGTRARVWASARARARDCCYWSHARAQPRLATLAPLRTRPRARTLRERSLPGFASPNPLQCVWIMKNSDTRGRYDARLEAQSPNAGLGCESLTVKISS